MGEQKTNAILRNANRSPINLNEQSSRKLFFLHEQPISSKRWTIRHGFGPSTAIIIYDDAGTIVDSDLYHVSYSRGESIISFTGDISGVAHVLSRNGDSYRPISVNSDINREIQVSYSDIVTFAIPRYITRLSSGSAPILPPATIPTTPQPSPTPLPQPAPYEICSNVIQLEVEVTRPNETSITCTERLDIGINGLSSWFGWPRILVGSRRHYCLKTLKLSTMKIFSNVNNQETSIPDNTVLKIKRIDYGTGLLANIPDRGLLVLLSDINSGRILDSLTDVGEMVGIQNAVFIFKSGNMFVAENAVETTYPDIKRSQL